MQDNELFEFYKKNPIIAARDLLNVKLGPQQKLVLNLIWTNSFCLIIICRGGGKTFLLAVVASLKCILFPNEDMILVAPSFRQSKKVFNYIEKKIYRNAPFFQNMVVSIHHSSDLWELETTTGSRILALPMGHEGSRLVGHHGSLIADEVWGIPPDIFDGIFLPFISTAKNPVEEVERQKLGIETTEEANQLIVTSTAYYQFNHLYKRFEDRKKEILSSQEKQIIIPDKVMQAEGRCLIDLNYLDIPKGWYNEKALDEQKKNKDFFDIMYKNIWLSDSAGPYRRSILDNARFVDPYAPEIKGKEGSEYVMGIDPGRTLNFFAITIEKVEFGKPKRLVYLWQVQNRPFTETEMKIRKLCYIFPIVKIAMDLGGGGLAIRDLLARDLVVEGIARQESDLVTKPIVSWDSQIDGMPILHMIGAETQWINRANRSMQSDLQIGKTLFPAPNAHVRGLQMWEQTSFDTALQNVDELINQFTKITIKSTPTGFPQWTTQSKNTRKDLYSSCILANWIAKEYLGETAEEIEKRKAQPKDHAEGKVFNQSFWRLGVNART